MQWPKAFAAWEVWSADLDNKMNKIANAKIGLFQVQIKLPSGTCPRKWVLFKLAHEGSYTSPNNCVKRLSRLHIEQTYLLNLYFSKVDFQAYGMWLQTIIFKM